MPNIEDFILAPGLNHIIVQIFSYLKFKDLKTCRRVRSTWKNVIERQCFYWKSVLQIKQALLNKDSYNKVCQDWSYLIDIFLTTKDVNQLKKIDKILEDFEFNFMFIDPFGKVLQNTVRLKNGTVRTKIPDRIQSHQIDINIQGLLFQTALYRGDSQFKAKPIQERIHYS